jgi:ferritin-like metal-binding protein YciE
MRTLDEQLTKYLTDAHSIEVQALAQLKVAPDLAGDPELAEMYRQHYEETVEQEGWLRAQLEAREADPSRLKDLLGRAGGVAMVWFARSQPDTPGKLAAHAFSYEHMELAAYDLLERVAERAHDLKVADVARRIRTQEDAMAARIGGSWDRTVDASLRVAEKDDLDKQLAKYLADAHAIEAQAIQMLEAAPKIVGTGELARLYEHHLQESREHQRLIEARLEAHDAQPSAIKDAALRLGALNLGAFFGAQPDTPAKLAGFSYAFEHLEIGGYEQLKRVAHRAGDNETAQVAERILGEERAAAEKVFARFGEAMDATLDQLGVGARA